MMLKTEEESLNTLRVASKEWPGLIYYQGITTKTALSTAEKATQTNRNIKNKNVRKVPVHQPKTLPSKTDNNKENNGKVENESERSGATETVDSNVLQTKQKFTKNERDIKKPRALFSRGSAHRSFNDTSLNSDDVTKPRRSSFPDKTLLSLPNVSWNEMTTVDEGHHATATCFSPSNGWLTGQPTSRPHTAGPRVIVPLKHTSPVGLSKEDIIRGKRLGCQNSSQDDIHSSVLQEKDNDKPVRFSEKTITKKEESPRKIYKLPKRTGGCVRIENLELTITSIQPESFFRSSSVSDKVSDSDIQEKNEIACGPEDNNNNQNSSSAFINSFNFNTMEGIRKSYRRAQSAPPTHHRRDRMQSGNNVSLENTSQKPFSSMYWRAKSAYHKRLEATSEEELNDACGDDHRTVCGTRRTLLRPLLRVDSEIKHSAGCPYKCKGCFKACLVSDDYVQKAIARAVDESENGNVVRKEKNTPNRTVTKSDIVKEALRRSQPLFHQVYGGGKVRGRIRIRPWPNYAWMDLKMKKVRENETGNGKQKDDDLDNGCANSGNVSEDH